MKLTESEQQELTNQLIICGEIIGLSTRLRPLLINKWFNTKPKDFKYTKQVLAISKLAEEIWK